MDHRKDVFISYSSKEYDRASGIRDILEKNGISVWIAPDAIPAGVDYASVIPDAIAECRVFLLLLSENSQRSKYVPKELDQAIVSERIIVPFQIDRSELTKAFDFRLKNIQRIEAYKDTADEYERLVKLIKRLVSEEDSTAFEKLPDKKHTRRSGGIAVYVLSVVLLLTVGAAILVLGMRLSRSDKNSEQEDKNAPDNITTAGSFAEPSSPDSSLTSDESEAEPVPPKDIVYYTDYEQPEVQYDETAPEKIDKEATKLKMVKPLGNYIHSTKFRGFDAYLEILGDWSNSAGNIEPTGRGIDADITGDGVYTVGISANSLMSETAYGEAPNVVNSSGEFGIITDDEGYAYPNLMLNEFDIKIIGMWDGLERTDRYSPKNAVVETSGTERCLIDRNAKGFFSGRQLSTIKVEVLSVKLDGREFYIDPSVYRYGIIDESYRDGNCYHIRFPYEASLNNDWYDGENCSFAESVTVTFKIEGLSALIDEMGGIPYQDYGIADLK